MVVVPQGVHSLTLVILVNDSPWQSLPLVGAWLQWVLLPWVQDSFCLSWWGKDVWLPRPRQRSTEWMGAIWLNLI